MEQDRLCRLLLPVPPDLSFMHLLELARSSNAVAAHPQWRRQFHDAYWHKTPPRAGTSPLARAMAARYLVAVHEWLLRFLKNVVHPFTLCITGTELFEIRMVLDQKYETEIDLATLQAAETFASRSVTHGQGSLIKGSQAFLRELTDVMEKIDSSLQSLAISTQLEKRIVELLITGEMAVAEYAVCDPEALLQEQTIEELKLEFDPVKPRLISRPVYGDRLVIRRRRRIG